MKIVSYYITDNLIYVITEWEVLTLPSTEHNRALCQENVDSRLSEIGDYLQIGARLQQEKDAWSKIETLYGYFASLGQIRHLKNIHYLAQHLEQAKEELDITYSQVIQINDLIIDAEVNRSNILGLPPDKANEMVYSLKKSFHAKSKNKGKVV